MIEPKAYVRIDEHGVWRVGQTRVPLESVVFAFEDGHSPEAIREQYPALSREDVYGAIASYLGNREAVHGYLGEQQKLWDEWREKTEQNRSPVVQRLWAMRAAPMPRTALFLFGPLALFLALASSPSLAKAPSEAPPRYKSPLGLAVDPTGEKAYVALHTADAVAVVDLKTQTVLHEIPVARGPHAVALVKDTLYVTCEDADCVVEIDLKERSVRRRLPVGQAPRGLAVDPTGSTIYVACRDGSAICPVDVATGQVQSWPIASWLDRLAQSKVSAPAPPLPGPSIATSLDRLAQSQDGYLLATYEQAGVGSLLIFLLRQDRVRAVGQPLDGASNLRGLAVWPNGSAMVHERPRSQVLDDFHPEADKLVVMVQQRPRSQVPATQVAQGWVFTNTLTTSVLWGREHMVFELVSDRLLDEPNQGYADPSDVVILPDGGHVYITCAGADRVLLVDLRKEAAWSKRKAAERQRDRELARQRNIVDSVHVPYASARISHDLTASRHYVDAHLATRADPRRLALSGDGSTLVVSNYLADSLTVIDAEKAVVLRHIPLGGPPPDAARRGEILFNSGKMTFQGQFTCASCHPNGGSDGLNWDLERDGIGNFKNTKSLLGVKDTAPYGWHGTSPTLADRVAGTLRTLHRHEPTEREIGDLVAYLESLPAPRPLPQQDSDKPAIERGRGIFAGKAKCSSCHYRTAYDDDLTHDVGTRGVSDTQDRFNTPALRGVARTAPYLHDGRAATLEEVFTKHNPKQRHGAAHLLTSEELVDLIAYLKSL